MAERILLVDDHPLTRSALAGLLTQHGFDVVGEASDGEEAIVKAASLAPDLILLDLSMPGLGDLHEAIQTVLCHGSIEPMQLLRDKLEIGEKLGEVPPETPAVPLQRDLENRQRKLRFKPSPASETFAIGSVTVPERRPELNWPPASA